MVKVKAEIKINRPAGAGNSGEILLISGKLLGRSNKSSKNREE